MKGIWKELKVSLTATGALALVLCGAYPLAVWALARGLFPAKAAGSLMMRDGKVVGSSLLAERFTGPGYFHPRPSAAGDGYDAARSGGSNLGPTSAKLVDAVRQRVEAYRAENGLAPGAPVPADAATASASGLDPHISPANALLQERRVAKARGLSEDAVRARIRAFTEGRDLGLFGEPRVNVTRLNLALDGGR